MISLVQKSAVYERVNHFVALGNDVFDTDLEIPHVRFDKRGTCGGTAWYAQMELNFNAGLMVDNWDEYMNQVIPHEIAHLLKSHMYGEGGKGRLSAHGYFWKKCMIGLGVNPDRTHSMDTNKVAMPKRKFIYKCEGCQKEVVLSSVRHNKMARGRATYSHCRGTVLTLQKSLGKMTHSEAANHKVPDFMNKAALKAKAPTKSKAPKKGSKIAHALVIYKAMVDGNPDSTRQDIISALSHSMQIEKHQAAGYYQNCKKKVG